MTTKTNEVDKPFDFILFGGTGDLSMRKLIPSLYYRHCDGQLAEDGRIIANSRTKLDTAGFIEMIESDARIHIDAEYFDSVKWKEFLARIVYLPMDVTKPEAFADLSDVLKGREDKVRVFYLSVAPFLFAPICKGVDEAGLITDQSRVALEKPLGRDQESANEINDQLAESFKESQIYRIDHYLGKETVQNLLALRFGNALFEPLWRSERISDVQITIAEDLGVGGRGGFYNTTGALRDMVQNHLLQLLVIIAMEPPTSDLPDAVRDEKIKVLRSLKPLVGQDVLDNTVRGQYAAGSYPDGDVPGYKQEEDTPDDSDTETYVAIKAEIESWRWSGVPFYLRSGKRLKDKTTEIIVNFKKVPHSIFETADGSSTPNQLVIKLQPEESVRMRVYVKAWGDDMKLQPVHLNLDFNDVFQNRRRIAYERLCVDLIRGNPTLFLRRDEVDSAWGFIDPIIEAWESSNTTAEEYPSGTRGPKAADDLISRDGFKWYED